MTELAQPTLAEVAHLRAERYGQVTRETRSGGRIELRRTESGDWQFQGYASTFNTPYEVEDMMGTYTEEFVDGSFTKTLAERDDIALLVNHEGLPLARTTSGTLQLKADEIGLDTQTELAASDPDVQAVVPKMQRGDLSQMSISFRAMRQEWDEDYTERKVLEARLYDVSIVTFPANPFTSAGIRGLDLVRELAASDPEQLLASTRSADPGDVTALLERATAVLDRLKTPREDEREDEEDGDADPDTEAASAAQRDTSSTMTVGQARRSLELMELEAP